MSKHQIKITDAHIKNATQGDPGKCPAALALGEYRGNGPRFKNPRVSLRETKVDHKPFTPTDSYVHTQELTDWIKGYDESLKKGNPDEIPRPATLLVDTEASTIDLTRNPADLKSSKMKAEKQP